MLKILDFCQQLLTLLGFLGHRPISENPEQRGKYYLDKKEGWRSSNKIDLELETSGNPERGREGTGGAGGE